MSYRSKRRSIGRLLAGVGALASSGLVSVRVAHAQVAHWPTRPIKIVVPFTPGGTTDFVARLVATELSKSLGQSVLVENKPGAGTVIGVDAVAKAAPDGYTFVCVANSFCVNHTLIKKLPYDSLRDFKPVALMGMSEHVLVAAPNSGLLKLSDIASQVRAGKQLSYASFGQGTSAHLAGEMLKAQLNLDITHVPYKGQAPALTDVLGGQVSMMFGNWPELRSHVQSGKLAALGMATKTRSVYAPSIATLVEQGVDVESNSWNGILAPAAVSDAIIERLNSEINKALAASPVVQAFQSGGIAQLSGPTLRFNDFIRTEIKRYADVIARAKIVAET